MKKKSLYPPCIVLGVLLLLTLASFCVNAQQQFVQVANKANSYCNSTCTLLDDPALANTSTAIIIATPIIEKGINLDPHPIGVYYINKKWSIHNIDQVAMPEGSKFNVQYFLTPDPDLQFVQRANEKNLREKNTRSFIDNPFLNNNPEAQFQFIVTGVGSGSVISEISIKYDNVAGQWYMYNTNGRSLDITIACNIVVDTKGKINPPVVAMSQSAPTTTAAIFYGNVRQILMTVEGVQQGKFKGETNISTQLGKSELMSFSFETTVPVDASSGQATGKHGNKPVTVTKLFGPASLQFYKAFLTNESLSTVTIEFYAAESTGMLKLVNTIKLTNVRLVGFRQTDIINDVELIKKGLLDELKFTYQKIEMKDAGNLIVADDNTIQN